MTSYSLYVFYKEPAFIQRLDFAITRMCSLFSLTHNYYTPAFTHDFHQVYLGLLLSNEDVTKNYCQISRRLLGGGSSRNR